MSRRFHILFAAADGWTVCSGPDPVRTVRVAVDAAVAPPGLAAAVRAALESDGHGGAAVAVCVPSAWCLSATIPTADLPRGDAKAMSYRLEEGLPVAAENVVADFVPDPATGVALGVCVRTETIRPVVDALEAAGVGVHSVVPTALAAAQGWAGRGGDPDRLLLCGEAGAAGPQLNLIVLRDGRPAHWSLVPAAESDLRLQLDLMSTESASTPSVEAADVPPPLAAVVEQMIGVAVPVHPTTCRDAAVRVMGDVLAGRAKPWVNFRRGPLAVADPLRMHRKWVDLSLVAGIALLLSLTAAFLFRASRYGNLDAQVEAEMAADFHRHFPTWQVPMNIPAVVDAQYRRSAAAGGGDLGRAGRGSALSTLRDVLTPLAAERNFQVDRMSFHDNGFVLGGRLQSFDQIDVLSRAVRSAGMVVAPAQTRREADGTWTFVLQGSRPAVAVREPVNGP